MRVKLIRKFANVLNGIDLTRIAVGDIVDLTAHDAALLVVEGWAQEVPTEAPRASTRKQSDTSKSIP